MVIKYPARACTHKHSFDCFQFTLKTHTNMQNAATNYCADRVPSGYYCYGIIWYFRPISNNYYICFASLFCARALARAHHHHRHHHNHQSLTIVSRKQCMNKTRKRNYSKCRITQVVLLPEIGESFEIVNWTQHTYAREISYDTQILLLLCTIFQLFICIHSNGITYSILFALSSEPMSSASGVHARVRLFIWVCARRRTISKRSHCQWHTIRLRC